MTEYTSENARMARAPKLLNSFVASLCSAIWLFGLQASASAIPDGLPSDLRMAYHDSFEQYSGVAALLENRWFNGLWYEAPAPIDRFAISNGVVRLRTQTNGQPTSLVSVDRKGQGKTFLFGYFEFKARFDGNSENWPALWLFSLEHANGTDGGVWCELDVFEYFQSGHFTGTAHSWTRFFNRQNSNKNHEVNFTPGQWNRFGMYWDENSVTWYLNGVKLMSAATPEPCKRQHLFIIFGAQTRNKSIEQYIEVDEVSVYQRWP